MLDYFIPSSTKKPKLGHSRSQSHHVRSKSSHSTWAGKDISVLPDALEPAPFRRQRHTHSSAKAALTPPIEAHPHSPTQSPAPNSQAAPLDPNLTSPPSRCHIELDPRNASFAHSHRSSSEESTPELLIDPWTDRQISIGSTAPAKSGTRRLKNKSSRVISEWFHGDSAPIQIGPVPSPTKEQGDPMANLTTKPSLASRLSFFTSKASITKRPSSPPAIRDEFIDLDIAAALATPNSSEPLSPASVNSLQCRAESLLSRMQAAYKERCITLRDIAAERDAESEEREGTDIRCQALKVQLDDMAGKLKEQDDAMMDLVDQLANERRQRREEEEYRKRTITMVNNSKRERLSTATTASTCESEDESSVESIFSRKQGASSPCMSMSSVSVISSPEAQHLPELPPPITPQMGRMQGGLASHPVVSMKGSASCRKYRDPKDSEAWNVVAMLKEENVALKGRISQMEGALDGCLDVLT